MNSDQPTNVPEMTIEESQLAPLGPEMPPQFRERLALALKTTAPDVLAAAEATYRGLYASGYEYVIEQIAEHLPVFLLWLPACLDPERTLLGYERNKLLVWTIPFDEGRVMVFEGMREFDPNGGPVRYRAPIGGVVLQARVES